MPVQLQRAMAAEAEASREARAKVIAAEGEYKASTALKEAAMVISEAPAALQLRYLQVIRRTTSLRFLPSSELVSNVTQVGRVLSCNRLLNRKVYIVWLFFLVWRRLCRPPRRRRIPPSFSHCPSIY